MKKMILSIFVMTGVFNISASEYNLAIGDYTIKYNDNAHERVFSPIRDYYYQCVVFPIQSKIGALSEVMIPEMYSRSVKNGEDLYGGPIYRYEYYYITKIGDSSFTGYNTMKKVTIPNEITCIGRSAFANCTGLTEVIFGGNLNTIQQYAFTNCISLTSIILPSEITEIGSMAFQNLGN